MEPWAGYIHSQHQLCNAELCTSCKLQCLQQGELFLSAENILFLFRVRSAWKGLRERVVLLFSISLVLKAVQNCNLLTWVCTAGEGQALEPRASVRGMNNNINAISMLGIEVGMLSCCWLGENALFSPPSMSTVYCQPRVTLFLCTCYTLCLWSAQEFLHDIARWIFAIPECSWKRMFTKKMYCRHLQKDFSDVLCLKWKVYKPANALIHYMRCLPVLDNLFIPLVLRDWLKKNQNMHKSIF